ncbi:MAG TPA: CARDB domain-containing protein [Vicinamibacterales bacterium]|nr:CARDB domain-containing protein [Vicinamibacterales bacterium]
MRLRKLLAVAALVVLGGTASTVRSSAQTTPTGPFVAGEILVKFAPGANANAKAATHLLSGGTQLDEIARTRVQRVSVPAGDEAAAIARYRRNPNVLYAEPNFIRTLPALRSQSGGSEELPGDYYFGEQWGLNNTGQPFQCIPTSFGEWCFYQGTPDADIDAPEAWAISTGSAVAVAVIDSGVDYNHPELAMKYVGGYDFFNNDADPMDDHGHGTHVAGTIAAAMNNLTGTPPAEEGVVGVAPNAVIFAYKVCGADGSCNDFAMQQAIAAAIVDGAGVINMSLGGPEFSQSTYDAVQDAWSAGLVMVAAAGNKGTTEIFYPAAFDNVISVAAFDEDQRRASFSNYGSWVDISAPGNVIMSTYRMSACGTSDVPGDTGCYTWNSGTSMAAPHVSGAAALVSSRPDITSNSQVVSILLDSADPAGVSTVRLDSWTIHGGLNLHSAMLHGSTRPVALAGADQTVTDSDGDGAAPVSFDGSASYDTNGTIVSYEWREGSSSIATGATATVSLSVGLHTLTLEVTDNDGESDTDTVVVMVNPANQVTVTASTAQAAEAGPTNGVFTISRTGTTTAPLAVLYTVTGTAAASSDYVALSGAVTIEAGSSIATVTVTPIDDVISESDETVVLTIAVDTAYSIGSPSSATVTIVSDDLPPDLIVASISAPATGGADADIVVTDATKNQGTGPSPGSTTGFFLSTNWILDAADVFLGSRQVPPLAAGATDTQSTTLHIPPSTAAGSYYVLAKADSQDAVPEGKETNNIRASGVVRIGPDLVVSALSAPASAAAGSTISVSNTAKNQGGGSADASTTRFYLSVNLALDSLDVGLGNRPVPPLAAGASDTASTSLVIPAGTPTGTYYVVAQADMGNAVPETMETNNTRASWAVRIGPDLIVTAISGPSTAAAGATITVSDTTKNQGAGTAAASATGFYLSTNWTIDSTDVFLGSRPVGELAFGATATGSALLQIPADTLPGSYYVIARADWNNAVPETFETNNDRASGTLKIGGDLVVSALSAPTTAKADGLITLSDTTKNQGTEAVPASSTGFYLSSNFSLDSTDVFLGSRAVGSLTPSQSSSASTQVLIPAGTRSGTYYVIAVADWNGAVAESTENNNTRVVAVQVGPDLVVSALSAPSSAVAGTSISASDTTKNQGADTAGASVTRFYLSSNIWLDASDVLLGTRAVPSLGVGLSDMGSVTLVIPASTAAGTYYIIAKADGEDAVMESLENNNTRVRSISISSSQ